MSNGHQIPVSRLHSDGLCLALLKLGLGMGLGLELGLGLLDGSLTNCYHGSLRHLYGDSGGSGCLCHGEGGDMVGWDLFCNSDCSHDLLPFSVAGFAAHRRGWIDEGTSLTMPLSGLLWLRSSSKGWLRLASKLGIN